jgi:nucleoid-associated protein YgaU
MGWGRSLLGASVLLTIGSVAMAQQAGSPSFVPISTSEVGPTQQSVVVEAGDHLWRISEEHLAVVLGRPAEDQEVDPYWRSVIETNRDLLISGDPDLIYPGEVVTLPGPARVEEARTG